MSTQIPQEKSVGEIPVPVANVDKQNKAEMLACCWMGKEKLQMKTVPKPEITDDEDVIVKVTGTTVCGSDLHLYHGEIMQLKEGNILGHECCGVVEQVGSKVTKVKPGDRVVAAFNVACGKCEYCTQKLFTGCETTNNSGVMQKLYGHRISGVMGYSHFLGGFSGTQAEFCRVLFGDTNLLKIPEGVYDEQALYLSDVVSTSYHAVYNAGVKENEVIGVWGLGPIGLNVCQWLRNVFKVKRIIAVDNVPERIEIAKKHWGVEIVNFETDSKVAAKILQMVPEGLDRSIDCAGFRYAKDIKHKIERAVGLETDTPEVINEMIQSTKKFGTVSLIADYAGYANHVLIGGIMEKGIRLIGCGQAPVQAYWEKCLEYITKGEFDPTVILTHRFPLDQTPKIYDVFDKKRDGVIKAFIETRFSGPAMPGTPMLSNVEDA